MTLDSLKKKSEQLSSAVLTLTVGISASLMMEAPASAVVYDFSRQQENFVLDGTLSTNFEGSLEVADLNAVSFWDIEVFDTDGNELFNLNGFNSSWEFILEPEGNTVFTDSGLSANADFFTINPQVIALFGEASVQVRLTDGTNSLFFQQRNNFDGENDEFFNSIGIDYSGGFFLEESQIFPPVGFPDSDPQLFPAVETETQPVPEPSTVLGSLIAIGFGKKFKRKLKNGNNKDEEV